VLLRVCVCCSVLQRAAVCCRVCGSGARVCCYLCVCCSMLQCVAVCMLQFVEDFEGGHDFLPLESVSKVACVGCYL